MTQEVKIIAGISVVTILIIIGAAFFLGKSGSSSSSTLLSSSDQKLLIHKDSNTTGPKNAKVTLVEFGDYQCPACGAAYPVLKQILQTYQGKIYFVFRNFPLVSVHQNALAAAEAAEAAGAQGKYWQMHDKLYETQIEWSDSKNPLDSFSVYAKELQLNVDQFKTDVAQNKYSKKIQADQADGYALGVNATPSIYLNGEQMSGIPGYTVLKDKIDALLKK